VLRPNGVVLIGTVNREWVDFHPSPFATRYFSSTELRELLSSSGFAPQTFGGFHSATTSPRPRVLSWFKRSASRLGLIPQTMRGKEKLKRLFLGPLETLPAELVPDGDHYLAPVALHPGGLHSDYTVLYAVGRRGPEAVDYEQVGASQGQAHPRPVELRNSDHSESRP
jgi:hypothetical protein